MKLVFNSIIKREIVNREEAIKIIALVNNCVGFGSSPFYGTQKVVVYDYTM